MSSGQQIPEVKKSRPIWMVLLFLAVPIVMCSGCLGLVYLVAPSQEQISEAIAEREKQAVVDEKQRVADHLISMDRIQAISRFKVAVMDVENVVDSSATDNSDLVVIVGENWKSEVESIRAENVKKLDALWTDANHGQQSDWSLHDMNGKEIGGRSSKGVWVN